MGYTGNGTIAEMQTRCTFRRVTSAGWRESHVHDVAITRESPNYRIEISCFRFRFPIATPAARLAAAIDILELDPHRGAPGRPARRHLSAGAALYRLQRPPRDFLNGFGMRSGGRRGWDWWLTERRLTPTGRLRMLVDLVLVDKATLPELHLLFAGGGYARRRR